MICRSWLSILICSMVSVLNAQTVNTITIESDTGSNLFELQELQSEVLGFNGYSNELQDQCANL